MHPESASPKVILIDKTIDVLHEKGWCQHELMSPDGRHCLAGAMRTAACCLYAGYPTERSLIGETWEAVRSFLGTDPIAWNDGIARSVEDVILMLKYVREVFA